MKRTISLTAAVALLAIAASPGKVRIGYCGPLKDMEAVKAAGFDYMEVRTSEVAALSDADYEQLAARLKRLALLVPAAYWFSSRRDQSHGTGYRQEPADGLPPHCAGLTSWACE